MINKIQDKCRVLWLMMQDQDMLKNEIEIMLTEFAEAHRKFKNGETVMVCDKFTDKKIGEGIVGSVKSMIRLEAESMPNYLNIDDFTEKIAILGYEIFSIKRNGAKSSIHFLPFPHFISDIKKDGGYYIKKLEK